MAEAVRTAALVSQHAVWADGSGQVSRGVQVHAGQVEAEQTGEVSTREVGTCEAGCGRLKGTENGRPHRARKVRTGQVGAGKVGADHQCAREIGAGQVGPGEVCARQIGHAKVALGQVAVGQIDVGQVQRKGHAVGFQQHVQVGQAAGVVGVDGDVHLFVGEAANLRAVVAGLEEVIATVGTSVAPAAPQIEGEGRVFSNGEGPVGQDAKARADVVARQRLLAPPKHVF